MEEKIKFINGWIATRDNGSYNIGDGVLLYRKDDKIYRRVIKNLASNFYFFIEKKEGEVFKYKTEESGNYLKLFVPKYNKKDPKFIRCIEDLNSRDIKHYEADLTALKRYCIDNDVEVEDFDKMKQLYFDIETTTVDNIKDFENQKVLSFAAVDQDGKEYFLIGNTEKELLIKINDLIKKFDILIGWNSGGYFKYGEAQGFDIPCLMARFKRHRISTSYLYHILKEDLMYRIKSSYSLKPEVRDVLTNFSLDYISKHFLDKGKIDTGGIEPEKLYRKDIKLFKEYNLNDARLVYELEKKTGVVGLTMKLNQWCEALGQPYSPLPSLDSFILREGNKRGVHFKTNERYIFDGFFKGDDSEIAGGFVLEPKQGLYAGVDILDFKSLYPSLMITFNISPDTLTNKRSNVIKTPCGSKFTKEFKGIIPQKIKELLEMRDKFVKRMKEIDESSSEYTELDAKQWVTKTISNAIYGIFAQRVSRYFKKDIAEAITLSGQYIIKKTVNYLKKKEIEVISSDTDSVFLVSGNKDILKICDSINKYIKNNIKKNFNVDECYLNIRPDKSFDKFIVVSKKRYAGIKNGKLSIKGLECVRRDAVNIAKDLQKDLLKKILTGESKENILEWFKKQRDNVLGKKEYSPEDIYIKIYLQKDLNSYGPKKNLQRKYTAPIHVRIAQKSKKPARAGQYLYYVITDDKPLDGVLSDEFDGSWCRSYYWSNRIAPVLYRVIITAFPNLTIDKSLLC